MAVWKGNGKFSPRILLAGCDALPKTVDKLERFDGIFKEQAELQLAHAVLPGDVLNFSMKYYVTASCDTGEAGLLHTEVEIYSGGIGRGNTESSALFPLSSLWKTFFC